MKEENEVTEDETGGWHRPLNGHEFEQTLGDNGRRQWQPTPVFLPGESQGWRSLVGCHLWGCTESDMTEAT